MFISNPITIGTNTYIKEKKALIFDMDGTIVDNISFHNRAKLIFLKKYGIKIQSFNLNYIFNLSTKELVQQFINKNLSQQEIKDLDNEKQVIYRQLYKNHIHEIKGLSRLLNEAKNKGKKIALATMGCRENIEFVIQSLGIKHYFNIIVSGDDVKKRKPHPDIYKITLSLLDINPKEAMVFEDTYKGVLSAQQAGISVIGVSTSHSTEEFKNWGVTKCISDFDDYYHRYLESKGLKFIISLSDKTLL